MQFNGSVELVSTNDLLLPEGMDEIFTVPLASLRDVHIENNIQLKYRPQNRKEQLKAVFPLFLLMSLTSSLIFYIPGAFPYQTGSDEEFLMLNTVFLVFPALGAALASYIKFYYISVILVIEVVLFIWMELPSFAGTHSIIPAPFWLLLCRMFSFFFFKSFFLLIILKEMILFCCLSGYLNTMIFFSVIRKIHPGGVFSQDFLNRWIALLSQVCYSFYYYLLIHFILISFFVLVWWTFRSWY